ERARDVDAQVHGGAGRDLLDVEVAAPGPAPDVGDPFVSRGHADEADHRPGRQPAPLAPDDLVSFDANDAVMGADAAGAEPGGHGAVLPAEVGEAERVERDCPDV